MSVWSTGGKRGNEIDTIWMERWKPNDMYRRSATLLDVLWRAFSIFHLLISGTHSYECYHRKQTAGDIELKMHAPLLGYNQGSYCLVFACSLSSRSRHIVIPRLTHTEK